MLLLVGNPHGVTTGGDPFAQAADDTPAAQRLAPAIDYDAAPVDISGWYFDGAHHETRRNSTPPTEPPLNTYAVLAPIFGVLIPPAGVAFGHLALPQIKRTRQRGWLAAVCGLVFGYVFSVLLVALLIWLLVSRDHTSHGARSGAETAPSIAPSPGVVTSMAPAPMRPHTKLDLRAATVGKCAEIEKRDQSGEENNDEALDLYQVPCQHRVGVYTVIARVTTGSECNSTYVASPPDRSFAVCLNRF